MNKKEINEIKKNLDKDSGFFTINHVVTACVDAEKKIKCMTNQMNNLIAEDESELIVAYLKKILSGSIGKNLLEYHFPNDAYLEGGAQLFMNEVLRSKLTDEELVQKYIDRIIEKMEYLSTYTIFTAHCTYAVKNKNKNLDDDIGGDSDTNYNFIITAICPVNLRIDGLIYDEQANSIAKKETADRIVDPPTDGFLFPLFSDRQSDINGVLYYTKNAKKPNSSIVEELLGCEYSMSGVSEKATFHAIMNNVCGDELDLKVINTVNSKIQDIIDRNAHETEIPTVNSKDISNILWESGISQQKLEHLPKVYETALGEKELTCANLVDKKTVLTVPGVTVNISKDGMERVHTQTVGGRKCLVIELDEDKMSVNGLETTLEQAKQEQTV
ncbi:MAG: DUF4317 domain-containing protein [Ruminococcus sp.]|jgi:hypothetical protein|nr:DUF4317 domain-containing protein [Ruminococcus sp.]